MPKPFFTRNVPDNRTTQRRYRYSSSLLLLRLVWLLIRAALGLGAPAPAPFQLRGAAFPRGQGWCSSHAPLACVTTRRQRFPTYKALSSICCFLQSPRSSVRSPVKFVSGVRLVARKSSPAAPGLRGPGAGLPRFPPRPLRTRSSSARIQVSGRCLNFSAAQAPAAAAAFPRGRSLFQQPS